MRGVSRLRPGELVEVNVRGVVFVAKLGKLRSDGRWEITPPPPFGYFSVKPHEIRKRVDRQVPLNDRRAAA